MLLNAFPPPVKEGRRRNGRGQILVPSAMRTGDDSLLAQASLHHPVVRAADTGVKADVVTDSIISLLFFDCLWLTILHMI